MCNTKYLPENFEQCRLEKTILWQLPYNLNVSTRWNALIQDGGKYHERAYCDVRHQNFSNSILSIKLSQKVIPVRVYIQNF